MAYNEKLCRTLFGPTLTPGQQPGGTTMQLFRLALAALILLGSTAFQAQGTPWPGKPIRWIVPYPPGGITDHATRVVLAKVQEQMGWAIGGEKKTGAHPNRGADLPG